MPMYVLGLMAVISFIICVLFQYYAFSKGYDFFLWYEFPFVAIGSFALFEATSRRQNVRAYPIVQFLSKYSFAVFLIHNLFRLPLLPVVVKLPYTEPVKAIILWILLILFSYLAAVIVYRIPRFGKYILYMRWNISYLFFYNGAVHYSPKFENPQMHLKWFLKSSKV